MNGIVITCEACSNADVPGMHVVPYMKTIWGFKGGNCNFLLLSLQTSLNNRYLHCRKLALIFFGFLHIFSLVADRNVLKSLQKGIRYQFKKWEYVKKKLYWNVKVIFYKNSEIQIAI